MARRKAKVGPKQKLAGYGILATLGLIQGLILTEAGREQGQAIVQKLFERGVLINFAGNAVLRFIPPLVVSRAEIDILTRELDQALSELA